MNGFKINGINQQQTTIRQVLGQILDDETNNQHQNNCSIKGSNNLLLRDHRPQKETGSSEFNLQAPIDLHTTLSNIPIHSNVTSTKSNFSFNLPNTPLPPTTINSCSNNVPPPPTVLAPLYNSAPLPPQLTAPQPVPLLPPPTQIPSSSSSKAPLSLTPISLSSSSSSTASQPPMSKYSQLLAVLAEMSKDIRPTYAGSKSSGERLRRSITHARILIRESQMEVEAVTGSNPSN